MGDKKTLSGEIVFVENNNEKSPQQPSVNPSETANVCSVLFLGWMQCLFRKGRTKWLEDEDLFPLLNNSDAEHVTGSLNSEWRKEIHKCNENGKAPRLWIALVRMIDRRSYLLMAFLHTLQSIAFVVQPLTLGLFLRMLADPSRNIQSAVLYTLALSGVSVVKCFAMHHSDLIADVWSMKLCAAVIGLIYKKVLTLSRSSLTRIGQGHIINLASNDAQRFQRLVMNVIILLFATLEIAGCIVLMWYLIGWEALVGIAFFFLIIVYNVTAATHASRLRHRAARIADKRLGIIGEIIHGIRAVKMYAWELNYETAVRDFRRCEIKIIYAIGAYLAGQSAIYFACIPIAALISIITLIQNGKELNYFTIFTLMSYLTTMKVAVCFSIGETTRQLGETRMSIQRIQKFLLEDPLFPDSFTVGLEGKGVIKERWLGKRSRKLSAYLQGRRYHHEGFAGMQNEAFQPSTPVLTRSISSNNCNGLTTTTEIAISDLSCSWNEEEQSLTALHGVTLNARQKSLVIVTGPVGSGKSSLLMSMIGELPATDGKIKRDGSIAYAPQTPWVFSGTVKENIIFGRPFVQERYNAVLEVCDLVKDICNFACKDQTSIGQRGVTLSGGQRARVSLARAVYTEADIYLLDDPLSAVDATVAKNIFEKCIFKFLSGKLRVLVTHQVQFLKRADCIVVLNQGTVASQGSYPQLIESGALTSDMELDIESKGQEAARRASVRADTEISKEVVEDDAAVDMEQPEEHRASGSVTHKTYWNYLRAGLPTVLVVGLVLAYAVGQVAVMSPYIWLSHMTNLPRDQQRASTTLYIYGGLVLSALVLSFLRTYYCYYCVIRSSKNLHNKMTSAIIKTPLLFFDTIPAGRIYNRFSKDIGIMDELLPNAFFKAIQYLVYCLGAVLLSIGTNYWMLIAVIPLVAVFVYIAWYYLQTSRQIKRIEATRCSSVYSHVSESLTGLEVIRSSGMQNIFITQFYRCVDRHTQAFFLVFTSARWLGIRLDCLCVLFITAVAVAGLLVLENAAVAGLALVFAVDMLEISSYAIRLSSDVENLMTSVERVMTYTKLEPEPGYSITTRPPASWPEKGDMEVKNLSLVYYEGGKEVLKGVSFSVNDKEKIGVVGRTGAGKSSVVASLFRMPEPSGKVTIDGIEINSLNIQSSRRAMSVITQDPVLFSGSLRRNLDHLECFQDSKIWMALGEVQMKTLVEKLPGQLCYALQESGTNFSIGERQLLCLARALLQGNKIIIMDEATANVDFETDRLIQEVIRSKFGDCTVITIAHRLKTVIDYDKILVLEQGEVIEFDSPRVLLSKRDGVFAQFVKSHNLAVNE